MKKEKIDIHIFESDDRLFNLIKHHFGEKLGDAFFLEPPYRKPISLWKQRIMKWMGLPDYIPTSKSLIILIILNCGSTEINKCAMDACIDALRLVIPSDINTDVLICTRNK